MPPGILDFLQEHQILLLIVLYYFLDLRFTISSKWKRNMLFFYIFCKTLPHILYHYRDYMFGPVDNIVFVMILKSNNPFIDFITCILSMIIRIQKLNILEVVFAVFEIWFCISYLMHKENVLDNYANSTKQIKTEKETLNKMTSFLDFTRTDVTKIQNSDLKVKSKNRAKFKDVPYYKSFETLE